MHCSPEKSEKRNDLDALCMRKSTGENDTALLNNHHFTIIAAQWDFVIPVQFTGEVQTLCILYLGLNLCVRGTQMLANEVSHTVSISLDESHCAAAAQPPQKNNEKSK